MKVIKKALKHAFVPHEHNNYKPHIFREFSVSLIMLFSLGLFSASFGSAYVLNNTDVGSKITTNVLVDLTNEDRVKNNLNPLSINETLIKAASLKASDMSENGYFAHTSPTGVDPWHWFQKAGYVFLYAGENLAINFSESNKVEEAWMNSPKHRDNILDSRFKEIGIAKEVGIYNGALTTYIVQLFGTPAIASGNISSSESLVEEQINKENQIKEVKKDGDVLSSVSPKEEMKTKPKESPIVPIVTNTNMTVAYNTEVKEIPVQNQDAKQTQTYSSFKDRIIFNGSNYIDIVYSIFLVIVLVALLIHIFVEIEKQHPRHILYGVWTLSFIIVLMYINKEIFVQHFIFM